jgi:hypothetical protein
LGDVAPPLRLARKLRALVGADAQAMALRSSVMKSRRRLVGGQTLKLGGGADCAGCCDFCGHALREPGVVRENQLARAIDG